MAAPRLADSLITFTFDSFGRPVISRSNRHPTILLDLDGDGVFEAGKAFSDQIHSARSLWFDGRTLWATGFDFEDRPGLYRLEDVNGDDVADTITRVLPLEAAPTSAGPRALRQAPDGLPVMLVDARDLPPRQISPSSPLAPPPPGPTGAALVRWQPQRSGYWLLSGGLRDPRAVAFNLAGEAFTFDSDADEDHGMPWDRGARTLHLVPGADYGWRAAGAALPGDSLDALPALQPRGRAAPAGVEVYHHWLYPPGYFDTLFEADSTNGRILHTRLVRQGATYSAQVSHDVEFLARQPLPVTALEVGPDGCLYFATAGAGRSGGLYRIGYEPGFWERLVPRPALKGILRVVRQPQPLSSWGRAQLVAFKVEMGERWAAELDRLARDPLALVNDRVQALFLLQRLGPQPRAELLRPLAQDRDPLIRAAAVYVVGQHASPRAKAIAAGALTDRDPLVRRRAAEAVVRMGPTPAEPTLAPPDDVYNLLYDRDRFVRYAGRLALERTPRAGWQSRALGETNLPAAPEALLALLRSRSSDADVNLVLERVVTLAAQLQSPSSGELALLRLFAIAAAESPSTLRADLARRMSDLVRARFPDPDERLSREMARVLAVCGQPEAVTAILAAMPAGDANRPLQLHYVDCLRSIRTGWTPAQRAWLARWRERASRWRSDPAFQRNIQTMTSPAPRTEKVNR